MTRKRWYMTMLFLPLLVPAMVALASGAQIIINVGMLTRLLFVFSLIGGLPYLIFSISIALWCRSKDAGQIKKFSWFMPWLFTPVCGLFFWVAFQREYPDGGAGEGALIIMALCVPIGFLYVAFAHLLTRIAQRLGWVKD